MSAPGNALFLLCALGALLSALGTVWVKSPIRAAMCLLVHVVTLSGLFLTLHAHLLAALQLLVYAGAVVVLFVFVIMMIGPGVVDTSTTRGLVAKTAATALLAIFTFALVAVLGAYNPVRAVIECGLSSTDCTPFGGVRAFSQELYALDAAPFELIGALLTVAVVGAIAVARGRSSDAARARPAREQPAALAEATPAQHTPPDSAANTLAAARITGGE